MSTEKLRWDNHNSTSKLRLALYGWIECSPNLLAIIWVPGGDVTIIWVYCLCGAGIIMLALAARRSIDEALGKYRSGRWQPPHPPSPRILQLPKGSRRNRRPKSGRTPSKPPRPSKESSGSQDCRRECNPRGKLEVLFGQEREFSRSVPIVLLHPDANGDTIEGGSPRRCKVTLQKSGSKLSGGGGPGVAREHCSDDVRDIFELDAKEEDEQRPDNKPGVDGNYSSDNENADQNGPWGCQDWKFQAEVLRAECNLLRMEKEVAVRKWEQGCAEMEHAVRMAHSLHSAVRVLVTGRKKIVDEKNAEVVLQTTLQNQIEALQNKLQELQKNSEFRENELKKCANFDRQALFLQRRLDKLRKSSKDRSYREDTAKALQQRLEKLVMDACCNAQSESDKEENRLLAFQRESFIEVSQLAEDGLSIQKPSSFKNSLANQQKHIVDTMLPNGRVATLRRRLDSLSMGMHESKEAAAQIRKEYKSMLSSSGNCSSRRTDVSGSAEQGASQENKLCSEHCKATIWKIAKQVQAETEQWSQMQDILHHVREEMEDLQKSRDFWEDHALHADEKIATLQAAMHEWRQKARFSEKKVLDLQTEVAQLRNAVEQVKHRHTLEQTKWLDAYSKLTQPAISSTSGKSSTGSITDSENLEYNEASVYEAKVSNQSAKGDKLNCPAKDGKLDERKSCQQLQVASPLRSSGRTLRTCKVTQNSHVCSHHRSLINRASMLSRPGTHPESSIMHLQQYDCIAEQVGGKKTKEKIQVFHTKENITLHGGHSQRENLGKRDQINGNQEHSGSRKSSFGSIRSPLLDIGNASPLRIQRVIFPLPSDESSDLGSP